MKIVSTKQGQLEGVHKEGYTVFTGVPYAKPPVGELRFREPQMMEPWDGIRLAKEYPNRSMQATLKDEMYDKEFYDEQKYITEVSEDSLYLNIWTPAKSEGEKLPVAFWIHGGAYLGGCGHEKEFDGREYCKRGVILVTINYRLGVWGFLAHPELSAESSHNTSGNYGTLDQIAALQWVYDNIEAFGGDPDNITIFGQSAGAMSVQTLISSPLTKNLTAKAIIQSGLGLSYDKTLGQAEKDGEELLKNAGVKSIKELRTLSSAQIMKAAGPLIMRGFTGDSGLTYVPVIDGYVLEEGYEDIVRNGNLRDIPYMAGSTKHDLRVSKEDLENGTNGLLYQSCQEFGRLIEEKKKTPAYLYYFTRELPGSEDGAFHSSELWYMFGTLDRCWRPFSEEDKQLSDQMLDCWTAFMKTGRPCTEGEDGWQAYTEEKPFIKEFTIR